MTSPRIAALAAYALRQEDASRFVARVELLGINPYVVPPVEALDALFRASGRDRGPMPVRGTLDGCPYTQTLVKYRGLWRLYINTPMRDATGLAVGDEATVTIAFDASDRAVPTHPALAAALRHDAAAARVFSELSPSRRKEINRYLHGLKSTDAVARNVERALRFLLGEGRFVGRDTP